MQIFDTHTHLNVENFEGKEKEEIDLARELGVTKMNIVGFDKPTIERALELVETYDNLYATIGWHPTEAGTYTEAVEAWLLEKLKHPKVIALGEIGLDYHWMTAPKEVQADVFRRQMKLAKKLDLPFVVHTRDALEDTYDLIKAEGVGPWRHYALLLRLFGNGRAFRQAWYDHFLFRRGDFQKILGCTGSCDSPAFG